MNTFTVLETSAASADRALRTAARSIKGLTWTYSETRIAVKRHYDLIEGAHGQKDAVLRFAHPVEVRDFKVEFPVINHNGWTTVAIRTADVFDFAVTNLEMVLATKAFAQTVAPIACEHCQKAINRSEVYIIHNGERFMQVGGKCASYYVPVELRRALRALAVTLQTMEDLTKEADDAPTGCWDNGKWVNFACLTIAIDNAKDLEFVPSRDQYGNSNVDATWRKVTEHAQNMHRADVEFEVEQSVIDLIREAGFGEELDGIIAMGEWISRRTAATMVTLYRRAQTAKPKGVELRHAVAGRQTITGKVISTKTVESMYGYTHKMLVEVDGGALRLWGTNPQNGFAVGHTVTFTAQVEPKELGFGFYSRPTKSMRID